MTQLGRFFRSRRLERGLSLGALARAVGYRNVPRGCNRIQKFEGGGRVASDLLGKLCEALEISPEEVRQKAAEHYRDWEAWADQPIQPYAVVRWIPCIYQHVELPDDALTVEAAEAFASGLASQHQKFVTLVISRRRSRRFYPTGLPQGGYLEATPDMPCEPYAVIGGKRFQFDFGGGDVLRLLDEPGP